LGGDLAAAVVSLARKTGAARAYPPVRKSKASRWAGTPRLSTTAKGCAALADALERDQWALQRERPAFLTWMALSWQARPGVFLRQIDRRQKFLEKELAREEATLRDIRAEVGHRYHEAIWMVSLIIQQFRTELRWIGRLKKEMNLRAPARRR